MGATSFFENLKTWARRLKRDVIALHLAARDRRTPWHAKIVAFLVAAYALSPVDLIPDFVPILGYLDDIILVPLGIALAVRMIPADLLAKFRDQAQEIASKPKSIAGLMIVAFIWLACGLLLTFLWFR